MKNTTSNVYLPLDEKLQQKFQLLNTSSTERIDAAVDLHLVDMYEEGAGLSQARQLFYAARWHWTLTNAMMRYSHA